MNDEEILQELEKIAERLEVAIRYENGDFKGGLCRIKENSCIIIQKRIPVERKIFFLARELSKFDLSAMYIIPQLRDLLQKEAEPF